MPNTEIALSDKQKQNLVHASERAVNYILSCQLDNGAIPWFDNGKLDPWDHCESIMALSIGGHYEAALRGLQWLKTNQNNDGSWFAEYFSNNEKQSEKVESNFVAYVATALWHYFQISGDRSSLNYFYPMLRKAIDYIIALQTEEGDIQWAVSTSEKLAKDALVTACASVLRSLESAICIAESLGQPCQNWFDAYEKLYDALKNKPWRFDRTWESKERYSMDWFYPILAGIYNQQEARLRLEDRWRTFVEKGVGCRCVSDEPWMTVAESCELSLALTAAKKYDDAEKILSPLMQWQDHDGGFWTGYNFRDDNIWPLEKTTWTAAAFVLASDALIQRTPAATLFTQPSSIL